MDSERTRTVRVVDYDPSWPRTFEALKAAIWPAVGSVALGVEHVGSTAVPGLAAKPIIDLDVIVATAGQVPLAIERLATLGYVHRGNLGIAGREAFESPRGLAAHTLVRLHRRERRLGESLDDTRLLAAECPSGGNVRQAEEGTGPTVSYRRGPLYRRKERVPLGNTAGGRVDR
jgi:GrpB-like predicted nucleotidyltransferase (UPF0157 family)